MIAFVESGSLLKMFWWAGEEATEERGRLYFYSREPGRGSCPVES